jgi:hypothetical protein
MTEGHTENKYGFDMRVSERHMAREFQAAVWKINALQREGTAIEA